MKWYVIKVQSGKEKKTKELIEKELSLNKKESVISTLLIPSQKTIQIRKGKKINVDKNLFPGYLFVECESINEVESNIKHINGVASVLKQPLTKNEVDRMLGQKEEKQNDDTVFLNQSVKIIEGPFDSFIGTIKELDDKKKIAKVAVLVFGREVVLELTLSQIIKNE